MLCFPPPLVLHPLSLDGHSRGQRLVCRHPHVRTCDAGRPTLAFAGAPTGACTKLATFAETRPALVRCAPGPVLTYLYDLKKVSAPGLESLFGLSASSALTLAIESAPRLRADSFGPVRHQMLGCSPNMEQSARTRTPHGLVRRGNGTVRGRRHNLEVS